MQTDTIPDVNKCDGDPFIDYALNLFYGRLIFNSPVSQINFNIPAMEPPLLSELCWLTIDPTKISEQIYADNSLKSYLSAVTLQHFDATIQTLKTNFIFDNESDETIQNTILSLLNRLGLTDVLKQYARYLLTTSGGSQLHG